MKLWLLASIIGLALAAALLGLTVERTDSARQQPPVTEFTPNPLPAASDYMISQNQRLQGPAAHGDGNRAAEEYLNEHVINGKTTTICAEDKALHEALTTATEAWNQALNNIAKGGVLTNHPNTYLVTVLDPFTGLPIEQTVTDCRGMDVEVLRRIDRSQASFCGGEGWGAAACYASKRVSTPRPRREFSSPDNHDIDTKRQPYGIIYYQGSDISHATLVHELGHVLGLSDYLTCDELRAGPDKTTGFVQPGDVDPLDDHVSAMRNDQTAVCNSGSTITGRDLRDFYETYRVGAINSVRLDGNVASNTNEHLSITFYWGGSGVEQASHNGSHVAVLRRANSSAAWTSVGDAKKIWTDQTQAREMLSVVDTLGRAAEYKIVGLTRGDIRRQTGIDTHGTFTVEGDTEGTTFTDDFTEGDPTIVVGISPYRESGTKRIEVDGPAVLSASVSPRYCDVHGTLTIVMLSTGGGTSTEESTKGPNSSFATGNRVSCGANPGGQLVSVKAKWGTGSQAVVRTTELPIQVHASPRRATRIATTLVPSPLANPVSVTSCVTGETLSLAVEPKSLLEHLDVWVNDRRLTGMSNAVECHADTSGRSRMGVMVLRSDGGRLGEHTLRIVGEFRPRFLNRQLYCNAGEETTANLVITGGQAGYFYSDKVQAVGIRTPTTRGYYAYLFDCPSVPVKGDSVQVGVQDASGRSRTASVPLDVCISPLPRPATPKPAANGVDSFAIALEWTPVPCARTYEVRYEAVGRSEGGDVIESHLPGAMVDMLQANTVYRMSVRAIETQRLMESFAASEWSEWVSVQTAPTAPSLKVDFRSWVGDPGGIYGVDVSWPQVPGATTYSDAFDVSPGEVTPARSGTSQVPSCRIGGSDVERICQNLAPDQTYEIEVRAVNSNSDASEAGTAVACLGPCGVQVSGVTTSGLRMSWTALEPDILIHHVRVRSGERVLANGYGSHRPYKTMSNLKLAGETTYIAEVRLLSSARGGYTGWVGTTFTTPAAPKPTPLSLSVTPSKTSCLTGGTVTLNWSVTGGSGKYEVSVDGKKQSGNSATVTCQATAGDQPVTVVVADKMHSTLTKTQTITLTVTKPKVEAPSGLSVDADVTSLTLKWMGPDDTTGYGVRIDGGAETKLSATTLSHPFPGLTPSTEYRLEVRAYVGADHSIWSSIDETTLSPPPLVLTAATEPTSCETNAEVTVTWAVTGGSDSHTVSVDGRPQSGGSAEVTCQATAGTQNVTVTATDTTYTQLMATQTLTLTVTQPKVEAPMGLSVDAEVTKLTLKWEGPDDATGYGVRNDGGTETKLPGTTLNHPFSGLTPSTKYQLEVRAYLDDDTSAWASIDGTTTAPPPLVLTASAEPTSCETNAQVTVTWAVTGGSGKHAVTIDGVAQTGSSTKVICRATDGTQSVKVTATDTTYTQLTATRTLSLTVTKTTPQTLMAKIAVQRLSDNRVEFRLRPTDGAELQVATRYIKLPKIEAERWYSSGVHSVTIAGTDYTLGVISARLDNTICPAKVWITFIPAGGTRITPTKYRFLVNTEANLWLTTSEFEIPLLETPQNASARGNSNASDRMTEAPEGASDGPGREGGLMLGDSTALDAQRDQSAMICTDQPTGLAASNITTKSATLSWSTVSGASAYDVALGQQASTKLGSTKLTHDFTGLAANTAYTLRVRARSWQGSSEWSSKTVRTKAIPLPIVTIRSGTSPITEGNTASFTVSSDKAWATSLSVKLAVSETGAMIAGSKPTSVSIAAGQKSATLSVRTTNDAVDESNSVITAKVSAGSGYRLGTASSASVTVRDNDDPPIPSCSGLKPTDTRDQVSEEIQTETHSNTRATRTNKRTVTQPQTRTVECIAGRWVEGGWKNKGAATKGAWTVGSWSCISKPAPPAAESRTITVSTKTVWSVVGETATQVRTVVTQTQRRTYSWSAASICLWQAGAWGNVGSAKTTPTTLQTKIKPKAVTYTVDSSHVKTGRTRVIRVSTTPICLEQSQAQYSYRRTIRLRDHVWSEPNWVRTDKAITPPVRYTYWANVGSQRLCALRSSDDTKATDPTETQPALRARFTAGTHELQWGADRLGFTIPANTQVWVESRVLSSGEIAAAFVTGAGAELIVTAASVGTGGLTSGDSVLTELASTLKLVAPTSLSALPDDAHACLELELSENARVDLDQNTCAQTAGQTVTASIGDSTAALTLTTNRDWLLTAGPSPNGTEQTAIWLTDLASGSLLAIDPTSGRELGRVTAGGASDVGALFDAIVKEETP